MNIGATGKSGEDRVVSFLRKQGWGVVKRNYQCRFGEIDIIAEKEKLLNQYPNLRKLIEDDESMALSEEEVTALSKVLCLFDDKRIIQEKELFLRGIREAYFFFKKTKIIE